MGPTIVDAEAAQRYEARIEGELAGFIDYVVKGDRLALIHTEVLPSHQGQGLGEQLVRFALDDARRRGLRVIPSVSMSALMSNATPRRMTSSWV